MIDLASLAIDGYFAVARRGVIDGSKDLGGLLDIQPFSKNYSKRYFQVISESFLISFSEERDALDRADPRVSEYEIGDNRPYRRVSFSCATFSEENTAIIVANISNRIGLIGQRQDIKSRLMKDEFIASLTGGYLVSAIEKHMAYLVHEELKLLGLAT